MVFLYSALVRDERLDPESRIYFHSCENKCSCSWLATPHNSSLEEKLYRPSLQAPHESQVIGFLSAHHEDQKPHWCAVKIFYGAR